MVILNKAYFSNGGKAGFGRLYYDQGQKIIMNIPIKTSNHSCSIVSFDGPLDFYDEMPDMPQN